MRGSFRLRMITLVLCLLAGCAAPQRHSTPAAPEPLRIGGDDAALTGVIIPVRETFEEENPALSLVTVQSRVGTELIQLGAGSLDAVVSTQPFERLLQRAAESGTVPSRDSFRVVPIGRSETVIFLNSGIKVSKLSTKQLKGIFTGRITNWKKIGGPNRRVVVVWSPAAVGENEPFIKEVLQNESVTADFVTAKSDEEVRTKVLQTPGAIGIGPRALAAPGVRVPRSPSLASSVLLITKAEPAPKVQKLLDLINDVAFLP